MAKLRTSMWIGIAAGSLLAIIACSSSDDAGKAGSAGSAGSGGSGTGGASTGGQGGSGGSQTGGNGGTGGSQTGGAGGSMGGAGGSMGGMGGSMGGMGGSMGGHGGAGDPCIECLQLNCNSSLTTCLGDTGVGSCAEIWDCAALCDPVDTDCINACKAGQPGEQLFDSIYTCLTTTCGLECTA